MRDRSANVADIAWVKDRYLGQRNPPSKFVVTEGPHKVYSDDELALIERFTRQRHASHVERFGDKLDWATNFISIARQENLNGTVSWFTKRATWRHGSWFKDSLPEALGRFWNDLSPAEMVEQFVLLNNGDVCEVTRVEITHMTVKRLSDMESYSVPRTTALMHSATLDDLADQIRMAVRHRENCMTGIPDTFLVASVSAFSEGSDPIDLMSMWASRIRKPDF